jgi:hypothetical protein
MFGLFHQIQCKQRISLATRPLSVLAALRQALERGCALPVSFDDQQKSIETRPGGGFDALVKYAGFKDKVVQETATVIAVSMAA